MKFRVFFLLNLVFLTNIFASNTDRLIQPKKEIGTLISQIPELENSPIVADTLIVKTINNPDQSKDSFSKDILSIIKELLTIVVLIIGAIGINSLSKRLSENHLKDVVANIHESNKKVREESIDLINKYIKLTDKHYSIHVDEVKNVYSDISNLTKLAGSSSKEIANYCFLLHKTIEGVIRYFNDVNDEETSYILTEYELYNIVNFSLSEIIDLSTSLSIVPKKIKVGQKKLFKGFESNYLNENSVYYYKGFRYGLEFSASSPIYYKLFEHINNYSNYLFSRSFFNIYLSYFPVLLFMFKKEIYFPPVLECKNHDILFGKKQLDLFKISRAQTISDNPKIIYKLYYSNFSTLFRFLKNESENDKIKGNYFDTLFADNDFNFDNVKKITLKSVETIEIEIYEEHIKELFIKNKRQIRKKLIKDKRQMELNSKGRMMRVLYKIRYLLSDLLLMT